MQIKTTMTYHTYLSEWLKYKRSDNTNIGRTWETGALVHCWGRCKTVEPLWKTVWPFLKNLNVQLPYNLAIAFLDI